MWRVVTSTFIALTFFSSVAAAQQPCTTDANRVVSEIYRHVLERAPDPGAQDWVNMLASGRTTVRELVRTIAKSEEHMRSFGQQEAGEGIPFERAVARFYRHILGRQADPEGQRAHAQGAQQAGNLAGVVDSLVNSEEYTRSFGDWGVPGSGGVTFCATNARSTSAAPAPAPRPQVTEPRFRGMDRNRDGLITRGEWNGSDQSFRVHDWDGDGVLDGDEVRAGAFRPGRTLEDEDFDRDEEFANLDMNRNNRIEPREWHASLDAFDRLDRNNDGVLTQAELDADNTRIQARGRRANDFDFDALDVNDNNRIERREWRARGDVFNELDVDRNNVLSRAELEVAAVDTPRRGVGTTGDFIIVDSSVRWTDTGLDVRAGQMITFDADGEIRLSEAATDTARAGGAISGRRASNSPVNTAPAGGLIARVGNGNPVYVGDRRALRVPTSGRLYLSVNDDYLADNQGEYRVTISVR